MFDVITEHPIAFDSPDHFDAEHGGAGNDNSRNPHFNERLFKLFEGQGRRPSVLDLGCAGGGLVKSLLDEGCLAVGIEGSDYCRKHDKFCWPELADKNLFNADVTKPFCIRQLYCEGAQVLGLVAKFDAVTAWEVMEHIPEGDLPQMIQNVLDHLKPDGFWVMSVSQQVDRHFHRCVHDQAWWTRLFAQHGLSPNQALWEAFNPHWVRGPEQTPWAFNAPDSFHLVLQRTT